MPIPQKYIENYFKRFAEKEPLIQEPIDPKCEMIIVIPCHNEPNLLGTLESLVACDLPDVSVEVLVVLNQKSEVGNEAENKQNRKTLSEFNQWSKNHLNSTLKFHLIEALSMPAKHAGVGLARKIGMDEALRRFISIHRDGTIVCLDADCTVSKSYLKSIDQKFTASDAGLGEVSYEHLFERESDLSLKTGILYYELFLRYYVEGLKYAGFPYAIQTIGSCMLVKASVYAKHGGMNKRKAGEDFYFLHKIIPHEKFTEVNLGKVYPSCRTSDRVPFGTGKAQQDWLDQSESIYLAYDPKIFSELKDLFRTVDDFYQDEVIEVLERLSPISKAFMVEFSFQEKLELIKVNCKSNDQFRKQFFIWFDGFLCMKYVHFVRDNFHPNIPIIKAMDHADFDWDSRTRELLRAVGDL
ncbi:glycosyltransferase [Roseivirga misakiensis]|uniref:Glycosyltransferase 2-like domain-containing protein n=1 Tax=Roseivirga misakiensis TaxID=1563681 RepID=A0A1E5T4M9_9BACT|nr:glycosyltransferase [Roseivirga misakiensis]OEK06335.1 hypothetical protein BFP71_01270 [Roseivirga misakiensis]